MAPITHAMLQKRAEHNEGIVATLKEVSLHQHDIERIEGLGQMCRHLEILYLQNNLIGRIENLERLKELQYINLAVNNIAQVEGLERCESLRKLDLTVNFVDQPGLLTVQRLRANEALRELYLTGNPCQDFPGYRHFVVGSLPSLQRLDGVEITASERIAAAQALPAVESALQAAVAAQGVDVAPLLQPSRRRGSQKGDELQEASEDEDGQEGTTDASGERVRKYSAATRRAEHREMAALRAQAEKQQAGTQQAALDGERRPSPRTGFDPLPPDGRVYQKNEGRWDFHLGDSSDGSSLVLDVAVGRFLDSSLLDVDVQPHLVRVLIKGRLLQLTLPEEICTDRSSAQRSQTTGHLLVTMPRAHPHVTAPRPPLVAKDRNGQPSDKAAGRGGAVCTRILPTDGHGPPKQERSRGCPRAPCAVQPARPEQRSASALDAEVPPLE